VSKNSFVSVGDLDGNWESMFNRMMVFDINRFLKGCQIV